MTCFDVTHSTVYRYRGPVVSCHNLAHLTPRTTTTQSVVSWELTVEPGPDDASEHVDAFGNTATYFSITEPFERLAVTARSRVEVAPAADGPDPTSGPWEDVAARLVEDLAEEVLDARSFAFSSSGTAPRNTARTYASASFTPGRPLLEATAELNSRIHADFAYEPGRTSHRTSIDDLFSQRSGVCQDFAHVGISCLRSLGIAARYVSGYIETEAPAGAERLRGADASHAWFSVWTPDAGWIDFDPTNDQRPGGRHVTVGWGRDYADVPPLKGVLFTAAATESLTVAVDVIRSEE